MLVITRKESEMIQIGDGIIVKVVQTGRGSIKIGIEAPPHVRILRGEMSAELAALVGGESLADSRRSKGRSAASELACSGACSWRQIGKPRLQTTPPVRLTAARQRR
ncbi:MAG: carbon storage regulator [Planctomycetaceae bacterium]